MRKGITTLFFILGICSVKSYAQPCSMSGIYKVGPGQVYTHITSAVNALRANGLADDVILELTPLYNYVGETFPLTFNNIPCIDSTRTVTIRPELIAGPLSISFSGTVTIDLNNARFIRFDGRPGGVGTSRGLSLVNTNSAGAAIRFINDASWNEINYVNLRGVSTSLTGGVAVFSTSNQSITNGNSNNKIINSSISRNNTSPVNCLYSSGTTGKKNSNNEVANCLITEFYNSAGYTNGIYLNANSSQWKITGNSIYHPSQRNFNGPLVRGIYINDSTSSGFIVENNFIGGSAPQCGGTPINYGGWYLPIDMETGKTSFSFIRNNTITNYGMILSGSLVFDASGIRMTKGKFRCENNTIGSQSITNSINLAVSENFTYRGIVHGQDYDYSFIGPDDTSYIKNNFIGGIYAYTPSNYFSGTIIGIQVVNQYKGYVEITDNTIGNPTLSGSIINNTFSEGNDVYGIYISVNASVPDSLRPGNLVKNNIIANIRGKVTGIGTFGGGHKIIDNTIHHFSSMPQTEWGLSARGIYVESGNGKMIISGNTIHSLTNIGTMNVLTGIDVNNTSGLLVEKNNIHSLQSTAGSKNDHTGIRVSGGTHHRIINNMVRLGMDSAGNAVSDNQKIFGLVVSTDSSYISNNSIYIGGSGTGESASFLLFSSESRPSTVINNIFVNRRSALPGNWRNQYAVRLETQGMDTRGFSHNIYYTQGANTYLGIFNGIPYSTIINWRKAIKADSVSVFFNPNFINPDGNSLTGNLHLSGLTPAESAGLLQSTIIDDIDNDNRVAFTPTDIGADAGNFVYQDGDAPVLTHANFIGQPAVSSYVYKLSITDNGLGVDTAGINKPRMWYRKKQLRTGNWTSVPGNLTEGGINKGVWSFTLDLAGAGILVNPGDSLQYYFVAQDRAALPNLGYSNIPGASHTDVNIQITPPDNLLKLLIVGYFPDTVYVGVGQTYTSLTGDGGFFQAAKTRIFDSTTANHAVVIVSNLSEPSIYSYSGALPGGSGFRIVTNTPTVKQIKNIGLGEGYPMIWILNASKVTIDGNVNGSGRYLHFINMLNTQWAESVICITGTSNDISVLNVIMEGNGENYNSVFSINSYQPLKNITLKGSIIRNAIGGNLPHQGISINLNQADSIVIRGNEISNFTQNGIMAVPYLPTSSAQLYIDSNHFYHNSAAIPVNGRKVIEVNATSTLFKLAVTNNYIGGTEPYCGGAPWILNAASYYDFRGIDIYASKEIPASVQNNTIANIRFSSAFYTFQGIFIGSGSADIGTEKGNTIGNLLQDSSIYNINVAYGIYGIVDTASPIAPTIRIMNNTVAGIHATQFEGISIESQKVYIQNNLIKRIEVGNAPAAGYYLKGIKVKLREGKIQGNIIENLTNKNTDQSSVIGIEMKYAGNGSDVLISRNRINNLQSFASGSGYTCGILAGAGKVSIENNQINLYNGFNDLSIDIRGIDLYEPQVSTYRTNVYYNTIRIAGYISSGAKNTYAVLVRGKFPIGFFRNNLLYNERVGGTGSHLALGEVTTASAFPLWMDDNAKHNLYVTTDTSKVCEWRNSGPVSMSQWRLLSTEGKESYASKTDNIPSSYFFVSTPTGDLNISSNNSLSWYVNGKGIPVSSIVDDFDSTNVRSTQVSGGSTDIGADEFNTNTDPPVLMVYGRHEPGGTDTLSLEGRIIGIIQWNNTGTLPTLGQQRWYSGVWPNDTLNNGVALNAKYMNSYWNLPATGGSGYSYNLTLFFDSAMLGKVTNATAMTINKRQSGASGTWTALTPSIVNWANKSVTISNLTSFSEFTITDTNATLQNGGPSADLLVTSLTVNPVIATEDSIDVIFSELNQGTAAGTAHIVRFYLSPDNSLTPGANGDILLGYYQINSGPGINQTLTPLTYKLAVPCSVTQGNYKLFVQTDGANQLQELNETNNLISSDVAITAGAKTRWLGTVSGAWENPLNWSCGKLPDENTVVVVYPTAIPLTITSNAVCKSITLNSGATVIVSNGYNLTIKNTP